jgi:transposase
MPPDLSEWVPENHLVHIIMEVVGLIDLREAKINERGTGSRQYPPALMLGLLIYSYATGTFSSRQIERATYENVAVRLLCADLHPDHDSICTFRRANHALLRSSFEQVLAMAVQMRVLKVGQVTLAVDGTKILANASKHSAVSHGRALAQIELLEKQVAELLSKAEAADSAPLEDGLTLPEEIAAVGADACGGEPRSNSWSADLRSDRAQVPWAYRPRTRAAGGSACAGPRSQRQGEDEASP